MSQVDFATTGISFSQREPEESQAPPEARASELEKLERLNPSVRSKFITDLSRLILFKALSGETIDKSKLMKEVYPPDSNAIVKERVITAAITQVNDRLQQVVGLELKQAPEEILENKGMPKKFKDRYYAVNTIADDDQGTHSRALHSVHYDGAIEKGLLMFVLALIYCKGEVKDHLRWLPNTVLFRLLHSLDDNIPAEPASVSTVTKSGKKKETAGGAASGGGRHSIGTFSSPSASSGASVKFSPNVDEALEKFVNMDYLVKKRPEPQAGATQPTQSDEQIFLYAMGPRSYLEIGKRQVLYFCAEVLEEEPDESMLSELKQNGDDDDAMNQE